MAERDPRAPRIRPVRTVNHIRPDYGGNVNVEGYDDSELVERVEDLEGRAPGHVVQDEGVDLPQRRRLNFRGLPVRAHDDEANDATIVDVDPSANPAWDGGFGRKIDQFEVVDDTVDTFTLSYAPVLESWNVTLNGVGLIDDGADPDITGHYTIDGTTLTVLDPTALFNGAADDEEAWLLHIQYDKASNVPTPEPEPPVTFAIEYVNSGGGAGGGASITPTWPVGLEAGDVVLALHVNGSDPTAPTYPAGWSLVTDSEVSLGGGSSVIARVYKYVADGTETGSWGDTIAMPPGSGFQHQHLVAYRDIATVGDATTDVASSAVPYTVPTGPAGGQVRFVLILDTNGTLTPDGVAADYNSGSVFYAQVVAWHESSGLSRDVTWDLSGTRTYAVINVSVTS